MNQEENLENSSICRLATKKQSLDDMYSVPANFLEIDVINPQTTIVAGKKKFTDYEIRMRVSQKMPFFRALLLLELFRVRPISLLFISAYSASICISGARRSSRSLNNRSGYFEIGRRKPRESPLFVRGIDFERLFP